MGAQLRGPNNAKLSTPLPINPKALEFYLQGNYYLITGDRVFSDEEKKKAADCFQQAINLEPGFAPAYVGLANAHDDLRSLLKISFARRVDPF